MRQYANIVMEELLTMVIRILQSNWQNVPCWGNTKHIVTNILYEVSNMFQTISSSRERQQSCSKKSKGADDTNRWELVLFIRGAFQCQKKSIRWKCWTHAHLRRRVSMWQTVQLMAHDFFWWIWMEYFVNDHLGCGNHFYKTIIFTLW